MATPPHFEQMRSTRANPVLSELARDLFDEHDSQINIISCERGVAQKMFKSYVQINGPEKKRVLEGGTQKSQEQSIEVLIKTLRDGIAAKEERATGSAMETKALGAQNIEGTAGGSSCP